MSWYDQWVVMANVTNFDNYATILPVLLLSQLVALIIKEIKKYLAFTLELLLTV